MPVCFQLIDKQTGKPAVLPAVDDKLCKELEIKPDPVKYLGEWYSIIGLPLACGKSFQAIRDSWRGEPPSILDQILDILERDYEVNSFRSSSY